MRFEWRRVFFCAVLLGVACGDAIGPTSAELTHNRAKWSARGPTSYTFVYRRSCGECLPEWVQPVQITVVDGEVTSVVKVPSGEPVSLPVFRVTIDSLFEQVATTIARRPYRFAAIYDPSLGYPASVSVDMDKQMVDDEWGFVAQLLPP